VLPKHRNTGAFEKKRLLSSEIPGLSVEIHGQTNNKENSSKYLQHIVDMKHAHRNMAIHLKYFKNPRKTHR
jgi:hypothetical protein